MKKVISLLLAVLLLTLCAAPALAVEATVQNAKDFLALLDEKGIIYTNKGLDSDGDEWITIGNKGDAFTYTINVWFYDDNESVTMKVWNIIEFDDADFAKVLRVCNNLNYTYRFCRFYVDETDNTVTISTDLVVREGGVTAEVTWELLVRLVDILDNGYEQLSVYGK